MKSTQGHATLRERQKKFLGTLTFSQPLSSNEAARDSAGGPPPSPPTFSQDRSTPSKKKRRDQVLQAQRAHRKRTRDYMTALEDEVVRLRKTEDQLSRVASDWKRCINATVEQTKQQPVSLRDCWVGQIGPGIFAWMVQNVGHLPASNGSDDDNFVLSPSCSSLQTLDMELAALYNEPGLSASAIPPHLEVYDALTKELLLNFCELIAPTLCVTGDAVDGYANYIIPLAAENPAAMNALLAASSSHLKFRKPDMTVKAILYRSEAIRGLQLGSAESPPRVGSIDMDTAVSGLATIVLLLVDDMINENKDFSTLVKLADTWISLHLSGDNGTHAPLRQFLIDQVQMMKTLVLPLYEFSISYSALKRDGKQTNNRLPSKENQNLCVIFFQLEKAVCQACQIFNFPCSNLVDATPSRGSEDIDTMLDNLQDTVTEIPSFTPGEHALVWVYFVAAARSTREAHCAFFTSRLAELYQRLGHKDISGALGILSKFRNRQMEDIDSVDMMHQLELICPI